jgi:hypothetical protein
MSGNSATDFSVSTSPISPEIRLFSQSQPSGLSPPVGYRRCAVFHPGHDVPVVLDGREVARIAAADLLPQADEG